MNKHESPEQGNRRTGEPQMTEQMNRRISKCQNRGTAEQMNIE